MSDGYVHNSYQGSGITLTPRKAFSIQREQIEHLLKVHPGLDADSFRRVVSERTSSDLDMDEAYSVVLINRHIPRGAALEDIVSSIKKEQAQAA